MIICIIQARMGSSRFFGKVLKKIGKKTVIEQIYSQALKSKYINKVIIATTLNKKDKIFSNFLKKKKIDFYNGSENDVLSRFYHASKNYKPKYIVRLTADCPFIDPKIIDNTISLILKKKYFEYVSNVHPPSFPDGMDVEVLKFSLLKKIYKNANLKSQREHVTTKIWMNPKKYRIGVFKNTRDFSKMRITLDYKEDLIVLKKLYKLMGNKIRPLKHIQTLLIKNPKIQKINSKYVREEGLRISLNSDTKIKYKII